MAKAPTLPSLERDPRFDAFADREPLFAVITDPAYLSDRVTPDARAHFFAGGESIVEAMFRTVVLHLDPQFAPTAMLEFGCGVGRLAVPLAARAARRGGTVTAVDRSPVMREHTRVEATRAGLNNLSPATPAEVIASERAAFDFVTCYLVLQRLRPSEGLALIRALLRCLLPGGIAVFQFPVSSHVSRTTSALRWMREAVPAFDALVQRARGERRRRPFVPSHVYSLNDVMGQFREAGAEAAHVVFDDHGDLSSALVYVVAPDHRQGRDHSPEGAPVEPRSSGALIDVRDIIRDTPIEVLNDAAEQYFATLTTWEHHLAKPFASADEAPALLADMAIVLRGLALRPGLTVLDFGAGSGWLSRVLTQLGCAVIALDVSKTALDMARALYERLPIIRAPAVNAGTPPFEPRFLLFDGRTIAVPDQSVDRIVCFHAFHHTANPDEILAEFGRILVPGGMAVFAEPGPTHSMSAKSQFEMRSYRVVENDVDIHHIWDVARRHGFDDIRVFAANGEIMDVSLAQYDDLCRGGETAGVWTREARRFLRNVSNFKLRKAGGSREDSSSTAGLACVIHVPARVIEAKTNQPCSVALRVTNTGSATWLPATAGTGGVSIGMRIFDRTGRLVATRVTGTDLTVPARALEPGSAVDCQVDLPLLDAGEYRLEFDCVAADVAWFAQAGSTPAVVTAVVR